MEKNIGKTDKGVRFILALVTAYLGYAYNALWYIVAIVLLITVFTGHCLPYKLFKISTVEKGVKKKK